MTDYGLNVYIRRTRTSGIVEAEAWEIGIMKGGTRLLIRVCPSRERAREVAADVIGNGLNNPVLTLPAVG